MVNTLAYQGTELITVVNSFMTVGSRPNVIKFFRPWFTNIRNKLESLSLALGSVSSLA